MNLGSSLITDGLVLAYDENNAKSYKGPVMSNLLNQITTNASDNGSTFRFFSGTEDVHIPSVGNVTACKYIDMYNDYNGGSNSCCPNPYTFGSPAVTGGTEYTYAILYKSVNRYTHPNYMYHYEFGPSGYLTEYGLFYTQGSYSGSERHLGDGWYWASSKFTSNAAATSFQCYAFMYQYATWNRFYVANVLLAQGDHLNLHPRYWPSVGQSRTNTQVLLDLTNRNPITATSLTYNNNGTFSFNGSSNYLSLPSDVTFKTTGGHTVEHWFKLDAVEYNSLYNFIGASSIDYHSWYWTVYTGRLAIWNVSPGGWYYGSTTIQPNVWYHAVMVTNDAGTGIQFYLNGVAEGGTHASYSFNPTFSGLKIGYLGRGDSPNARYMRGSMPVTNVYNRALSANEVQQNFNALRGRYGL